MFKRIGISMLMVLVAFSGVFACQGDDCKIVTPDFVLEIDNTVGINGMTFDGTNEVQGCNADGMYEKSKMNFTGSAAGVTASQNVAITGDLCGSSCYSPTGVVAGSIIDFAGNVDIAGKMNNGNATAGYSGNMDFKGTSGVGVGSFGN